MFDFFAIDGNGLGGHNTFSLSGFFLVFSLLEFLPVLSI